MKRSLLSIAIIATLCSVIIHCGESSSSTPVVLPDSTVYISGACKDSNDVYIPGYWKNNVWTGFDNPNNSGGTKYPAYATSIVIDGTDVYVGGYCYTATSNVYSAGYWKNGTWNPLTNSYDAAKSATVYVLVVVGTDIYAGGSSKDDIEKAGYWLNNTWHPLGTSNPRVVNSMYIEGTHVHAAGHSYISTSYHEGRYWYDGAETPIQNTYLATKDVIVNAMTVSGTDVYLAGYCSNNETVSYAVAGYWLNGIWNPLTNIYGSYLSLAYAILVDGTDIYVGGFSRDSSGKNIPGYWKNGTWNPLSYPAGGEVHSIVKYGDDVYFGGSTYDSSYNSTACYWVKGTRVDMTDKLDAAKTGYFWSMAVTAPE